MTPSAASLKAIRERRVALGDPIVLITESERDNLFDVIDALAGALKAFVSAEDEWREVKAGMPEGTFDDPLSAAYAQARAALALVDPA